MRVSWWMWAFIAWLVLSVPFAIFTAKLIAMSKDAFDGRVVNRDVFDDVVIDLPGLEASEMAARRRRASSRVRSG